MARISRTTRELVLKSRDSAAQAVSTYNDPRSYFRTGNFTVLMIIAWTSLFHAIFEREKTNYFYKKTNGRYERVDGEKKAWEISKCTKEHYRENDPVRKNIELFIKLRNQIEHRSLPGIDPDLVGECQALALNFEQKIVTEFGQDNSLVDTFFIPIQLTSSVRNLPKTKNEEGVLRLIKDYRSVLEPDVINSQEYSFKAYLVPKIGNHRSSSDIAIEFVKFDENDPQEMKKYEKAIVGIKENMVPVANANLLRPGVVLDELKKAGHDKSMSWHIEMWKKYKVRPAANNSNKSNCKSEYCVYDSAHGDYLYTEKWVSFLTDNELSGRNRSA